MVKRTFFFGMFDNIKVLINSFEPPNSCYYCISPNVGRYCGLVTGPPPPPAMEAMEAAATERFRRERSSIANLTRIDLIFNLRHRRSEVTVFIPFCLFVCYLSESSIRQVYWSVGLFVCLSVC